MTNIPPMLSTSPPPLDEQIDEEEDEFNNIGVSDFDYGLNNDSMEVSESPPPWEKPISPTMSPLKQNGIQGYKSLQYINKKPNGLCKNLKTTDSIEEIDDVTELNQNFNEIVSIEPGAVENVICVDNFDGVNEFKDTKTENVDNFSSLKVENECEIQIIPSEIVSDVLPSEVAKETIVKPLGIEEEPPIPEDRELSPPLVTAEDSPPTILSNVPEIPDIQFDSEGFDSDSEFQGWSDFKHTGDPTDIPDLVFDKLNTMSDVEEEHKIDDFADFKSISAPSLLNNELRPEFDTELRTSNLSESRSENISAIVDNDSCEDDFCDFITPEEVVKRDDEAVMNNDDDDFGEFEDFEKFSYQTQAQVTEDNFSDFNFDDFQSVQFSQEPPKFDEVVKRLFKSELTEVPAVECDDKTLTNCLEHGGSVWSSLKVLETSPALSYQWNNSTSNKTLLSSLNIDSRNVLFGPRWNPSIPRFAANLGNSPLEPVQAATSSISSASATLDKISHPVEEVVPAAQFDWTSSGLTNPLDSAEKTIKLNADSESVVADRAPTTADLSAPASTDQRQQQQHVAELSSDAVKIIDSIPDMSFLSARKLMYAAGHSNLNRFTHNKTAAGLGQ